MTIQLFPGPVSDGCGTPADPSATDTEPLDDRAVARDVRALEVLEEAAALADQDEQATTRVMIVLVALEVLGEVADATGEHGDLDLGAAGVRG